MRLLAGFLVILGLVAGAVGTFSGFGALFTWNGRHAVDVQKLSEVTKTHTFVPKAGRRYTLSVEVAFDREGLDRREGLVVVEAKMPLVVHVRDSAGTSLAEATGWLDPNEPPNVLYGQAAHGSTRGPLPELVAVRVVGPFIAATATPIGIEVTVGPDRLDSARVTERRLVIHDDALPGSIRNAFLVAGGGIACLVLGVGIFVARWFQRWRRANSHVRRDRLSRREGGIRTHERV